MRKGKRQEPEPNAEDRRFVGALRRAYEPPAMPPARRDVLRQAVESRLAQSRHVWVVVPALGGAVAAAVAAWFVFVSPSPSSSPAADSEAFAWEEELFFSNDLLEAESGRDTEFLPEDYEAIAAYFLEL
jgi:hypothetical protein